MMVRQIEELQVALRDSEKARKGLEAKIDTQDEKLEAILAAIQKIPERTVVTSSNGNGASKPVSDVVGGEAPMYFPENLSIGTDARINMHESEGDANLEEAAQKLRELRKRQGGG